MFRWKKNFPFFFLLSRDDAQATKQIEEEQKGNKMKHRRSQPDDSSARGCSFNSRVEK